MKFSGSPLIAGAVVISSILLRSVLTSPTNPPVRSDRTIEAHLTVPPTVQRILERSCYDCHSYRTQWPWYAGLPGIGHLLQSDVTRARRHLNLSDWSTKLAEGQDEAVASLNGICEELRTDSMPIRHYRWLHRNAGLSSAEVETVCHWTSAAQSPNKP
jgi:hypothetical protein